MANPTTTPTPTKTTTTKAAKKDAAKKTTNGKRPLLFDRPEKYSDDWIDKELLTRLAIVMGKKSSNRRSDLLAAIKILSPDPQAQNWALENSVVQAAIKQGSRKMAALQLAAQRCRVPTLRVQSDGEIIPRSARAIEIVEIAFSSKNPHLHTRWREIRTILQSGGFSSKIFAKVSAKGRAADKKRLEAKIDDKIAGTDRRGGRRRK